MSILYVETNFPVSIATGRDRGAADLLDRPPPGLLFVLPAICYHEAFDWMEGEIRRHDRFRDDLRGQIIQFDRDLTSPHAQQLRTHLTDAIVERGYLLEDVDRRLFAAIRRLASVGEIPGLTEKVLGLAGQERLIEQLTDNLILHTILEHARSIAAPTKAFLTENHRDFGTPEVREALRSVGIEYFRSVENYLGWASSRPSTATPGSSDPAP